MTSPQTLQRIRLQIQIIISNVHEVEATGRREESKRHDLTPKETDLRQKHERDRAGSGNAKRRRSSSDETDDLTVQFRPWTQPAQPRHALEELAEQIAARWERIYKGRGDLHIHELRDYWDSTLDLADSVGDVFDDRSSASGGNISTSICKVVASISSKHAPHAFTPVNNNYDFFAIPPESSARPTERFRAVDQEVLIANSQEDVEENSAARQASKRRKLDHSSSPQIAEEGHRGGPVTTEDSGNVLDPARNQILSRQVNTLTPPNHIARKDQEPEKSDQETPKIRINRNEIRSDIMEEPESPLDHRSFGDKLASIGKDQNERFVEELELPKFHRGRNDINVSVPNGNLNGSAHEAQIKTAIKRTLEKHTSTVRGMSQSPTRNLNSQMSTSSLPQELPGENSLEASTASLQRDAQHSTQQAADSLSQDLETDHSSIASKTESAPVRESSLQPSHVQASTTNQRETLDRETTPKSSLPGGILPFDGVKTTPQQRLPIDHTAPASGYLAENGAVKNGLKVSGAESDSDSESDSTGSSSSASSDAEEASRAPAVGKGARPFIPLPPKPLNGITTPSVGSRLKENIPSLPVQPQQSARPSPDFRYPSLSQLRSARNSARNSPSPTTRNIPTGPPPVPSISTAGPFRQRNKPEHTRRKMPPEPASSESEDDESDNSDEDVQRTGGTDRAAKESSGGTGVKIPGMKGLLKLANK